MELGRPSEEVEVGEGGLAGNVLETGRWKLE